MSPFKRSPENPVLKPNSQNDWEAEGAFNCCPVVHSDRIHFVYRAVSRPHEINGQQINVSSIGHALSTDGLRFSLRRQFIQPEHEWEAYGCEDPRVTRIGNKFYIFYTALSGFPFRADTIRIGLAITENFRKIEAKHLVTNFNSKAMAMFPGKIDGKFATVLSVDTDNPPAKMGLAFFEREEQMWSHEYWEGWYALLEDHILDLQRSEDDHIEVGAPPIRTPSGWLLIYSYIRNYFSGPPEFGIEGALLDLENPSRILVRTEVPWLVPKEFYEIYGKVPNVIFPSGAMVRHGRVYLYYGAADTTCGMASANLRSLIDEMMAAKLENITLSRFVGNPIIKPKRDHPWEAKATFNPGALYAGQKVHLLYRAMGEDNTSVLGYASSKDGLSFKTSDKPAYIPREPFELKLVPGCNSGCEDPRLTKIDDIVYMCYTAFDGRHVPRVAFTSIPLEHFLAGKWCWEKPELISPPRIMDKDAALFPRKIKGKYAFLHRLGNSIWLDYKDTLDFSHSELLKGSVIMSYSQEGPDVEKIGLSTPPLETKFGWLLLYHIVAKLDDDALKYYLSAALLEAENPDLVIARRNTPLLEPQMPYEKDGIVPNVVFPGSAVLIKKRLFVYYGGADTVIGVATIKLDDLLESILLAGKNNPPE